MSVGLDHSEAVIWTRGEVRGLGTLGGTSATARDLNQHGAVVGRSQVTPGGGEHAFLWTEDGGMVPLPDLDAVSSTAYGINVHGQIAGWIERPIGPGGAVVSTPVMWEDGQLVLLPTLSPGESGQARRINDQGQIAGSSGDRAVVRTLTGSSR